MFSGEVDKSVVADKSVSIKIRRKIILLEWSVAVIFISEWVRNWVMKIYLQH